MTLIQGAGVRLARPEDRHIFAPVVGEAAEAVEELQIRRRRRDAAARGAAGARLRGGAPASASVPARGRAGRRACRAAPTSTTRATDCEQRARLRRQSGRRAARRRCPRRRSPVGRGRDWLGAHQRLQRDLQILHIGRRALVQDHQIDGQLLHPPVFVGAQQLADDDRDPRCRRCAAARSAGRRKCPGPQPRLRAAAAPDRVGGRPQRRRRRTADGRRGAGTGRPRRGRCRDDAAAPAPGSRPGWPRARRRSRRDACRRGRAPRRATSATMVQKAMRTVAPGATRTRRRRRRSDRARCRRCWTAAGRRSPRSASRMPWPRPRKRARSVSNCTARRPSRLRRRPDARPRPPARSATRRRRVARSAPSSATILGLRRTASRRPDARRRRPAAPARARHRRSARSRATRLPALVIETRRTSASSSAETSDLQRRRQRAVAAGDLGAVLGEHDLVAVGLDAARLVAGRPDLAAARHRAGRRRSPSRRRWRPRASASRAMSRQRL